MSKKILSNVDSEFKKKISDFVKYLNSRTGLGLVKSNIEKYGEGLYVVKIYVELQKDLYVLPYKFSLTRRYADDVENNCLKLFNSSVEWRDNVAIVHVELQG